MCSLGQWGNIISRFVGSYFVKAGVTYRLITDHLGSIRNVVNTNTGAIVQRVEYDEFGNVTQNTNPDFQPFAYAGGLYDSQTKLVKFGARDYDATIGRWTTKDPIEFGGKDANLFAYVGSDPVNNVDSDGFTKGGKQNIRVGNFNVHSDPNEIQKAIDEAIKLKQSPEHIKKLKALHKVASRIKKFKGLSLRFPLLAGLTDEAIDILAEAALRTILCGGSFGENLEKAFRDHLNAPPPAYFRDLFKDNNELFSEPIEA